LLSGVARMSGQPTRAADELAFAAAGPAVTLVIALVCGGLAIALPASTPETLRALLDHLTFVNVAILALNLLPASHSTAAASLGDAVPRRAARGPTPPRGPRPELLVDDGTDLADLVERPAFLRARRALMRRADGSIGLIALEDVEELAQAVELAGGRSVLRARKAHR
jgi:hypothetical protein